MCPSWSVGRLNLIIQSDCLGHGALSTKWDGRTNDNTPDYLLPTCDVGGNVLITFFDAWTSCQHLGFTHLFSTSHVEFIGLISRLVAWLTKDALTLRILWTIVSHKKFGNVTYLPDLYWRKCLVVTHPLLLY